MKKTKIVCTVGPASESQDTLEKLLNAGMNVMRLNFSHGDFEEHGVRVKNLRSAMEQTGKVCAVLQDLSGPKIRIGEFEGSEIDLITGQKFNLTTENILGNTERVFINYPKATEEIKAGHTIFINDGKIKLNVLEIKGSEITCEVLIGGRIKGRRGVNLPDSDLSMGSLTEKDRSDVRFGIDNNVDFMALSYVRRAEDILELRELIKGKCKAKIVAKIETPQAIKNIDEIIKVADAIMIARGDLAVEVPAAKVPMIQKEIIGKCNAFGVPVITATQMLETMIENSVPTRAEVSDIANAILDGTDALMLSAETTLGKYPIEAVNVMNGIALEIEANYPERAIVHSPLNGEAAVTDSITGAVVRAAHDVGAKAIVALTGSGFTARMISRHKPRMPIFALSSNQKTVNQVCLSFGVKPILIDEWKTVSEAFQIVRQICLRDGIAVAGDRVVIAAGAPEQKNLETNMILVETI